MDVKTIKYNRLLNEFNNYLNTLTQSKTTKYLRYESYYNNVGDILFIDHLYEEIFVYEQINTFNMDEELLFSIIKKFANLENYSVKWESEQVLEK